METGLGQRAARLALSAARRVSGRADRHRNPDRLVDYVERATGRTSQSEPHDEPVESAMVFPWIAGDAGLLRSLDCRRYDARFNHRRFNGYSVYRHESAGFRLLH